MSYLNEHFYLFCKKLDLPEEAVTVFEDTVKAIEANSEYLEKFNKIYKDYMFPKAHDVGERLDELTALANEMGISEYTLHFVFFMICSEVLLERYKEENISEAIYWESMMDMKYKFNECLDCKGVYGSFVASWFDGFFRMMRYSMGRFQFEYSDFDREDYTTESGITIKKGEEVLGFHIPWSGVSLTDDVRIDSYKKAYEFFKEEHCRPDGLMIFKCGSWLLYKGHYDFLPEKSNVLRFMDDFIILESNEKEEFNDAWRLYGGAGYKKPEEWPEDNSLYRAFKQRVLSGGKTGSGFGIVIFDGEKVVK